MTNTNKTLEQKTEKENWKQWLPIYGVYQIYKDFKEDKSGVVDGIPGAKFAGSAFYQAVSVFGAGVGLYALAEKLF